VFYDNALLFIKRQLSVEQLIYGLIEQYRLNTYLIEKGIINLESDFYKHMLDYQKIQNGNLSENNNTPDVVKEIKIERDDIS
jgi:hypothetical protein